MVTLDVASVELDDELRKLRALLRTTPGTDPGRLAELGTQLVALTAERDRRRRRSTAMRFAMLERIHAAHDRLRTASTVADLLPATVRELGRCCGFDHTALFGVNGSHRRLLARWVAPDGDPELARHIAEQAGAPLVTELARRRTAVLVDPDAGIRASVAAPVVVSGQMIGFLQAGGAGPARRLGFLDRANLASFADGFGPVFERAALRERLRRQREGIRDAFVAADRQLSGIGDGAPRLIRGETRAGPARRATTHHRTRATAVDRLLSERERQVLELMARGARNRHIAEQLVISEETVKSHVRSITRKLRASGRAEAVACYLRLLDES